MSVQRQHGFTLLELMVAISIFALVSVIAFTGLQTTLSTRDQVQAQSERLIQMQRMFTIIQQDLLQAVDRPIRDRFGDERGTMLTELGMLEWTRGGHPNPMGLPRSSLLRVAYMLEDDVLLRQQLVALDQPYEPNVRTTELIDDVESLEFRFLDANKEWVEDWPPVDPNAPRLPRAVEVRFEFADLGPVHRMFLLPF